MATSTSRGAAWGERETKVLIGIWGDVKIQAELDGKSRTKQVYDKISEMMSEQGYSRDGEQCKTKIKNLKKMYTAVKDHNNVTGNDKKTCSFFDELDAILGHRPASAPTVVLDASAGGLSEEPTEEREDTREREEDKREYADDAAGSQAEPEDNMPQRKKQKIDTGGAMKAKSRKTRAERALDTAMREFKEMQQEAEQNFRQWEEEKWQKENEIEERRRREDREHEMRLFQMMLQATHPTPMQHQPYPPYTYTNYYDSSQSSPQQ